MREGLPLTISLFTAAIAAGAYVYWRSSTLGDLLPNLWRFTSRSTFALAVFLAVWSLTTYSLWAAGVRLSIRTIETGAIKDAWWLPPATILFAVAAYWHLRKNTSKH